MEHLKHMSKHITIRQLNNLPLIRKTGQKHLYAIGKPFVHNDAVPARVIARCYSWLGAVRPHAGLAS